MLQLMRMANVANCNLVVSSLRNNHQLFKPITANVNSYLNKPEMPTRPYSTRNGALRLAEVGRLETPKYDGQYGPGQLFLHRIFGYRGVILFPWLAKVHDNDIKNSQPAQSTQEYEGKSSKPHFDFSNPIIQSGDKGFVPHKSPLGHVPNLIVHPYYQVLIDTTDCKFVSTRTQTANVTFLGTQDNENRMYSILGSDYVAHEDILPYTSHEKRPIHHELFDQFFEYSPDAETKFTSREYLKIWKSKSPWLNLSDVYKETTENVRVTVIPFYLGCTKIPEKGKLTKFMNWWRYCVRLENLGDQDVHLLERYWKIRSHIAEGANSLEKREGRGVVGVEPILSKNEPAFQYSSHVSLEAENGYMWGTYKMQRCEDRYIFDCKIPTFTLESRPSPSS